MDMDRVRAAWDAVAEPYAEHYWDELARKPFDRVWLDRLVGLAGELGPICDMGCGPGHVGRYLRDRGAEVVGADLSEEMLRQARRLNPDIAYHRQDMLALTLPPDSLGAVAAFYAIVNLTPEQTGTALGELRRVLVPGGYVLLAFHVGEGTVHVDELLGRAISLDFTLHDLDDVVARLQTADLDVEEVTIRYPYPDVEYPSRRAYILARRLA
jgi:ubiquinone/menaquinone biosynthesis C-methylase UbiE